MSVPKHIKEHAILGIDDAAGTWPGLVPSVGGRTSPAIATETAAAGVQTLVDGSVAIQPFILPDNVRTLASINTITGDNSAGTPAFVDIITAAVWDGVSGALLKEGQISITAGVATETARTIGMGSDVDLPKYVLVGIAGAASALGGSVIDCNFRSMLYGPPIPGISGLWDSSGLNIFPSTPYYLAGSPPDAGAMPDPIGTLNVPTTAIEPIAVSMLLT